MDFLTVKEASQQWNISERRIVNLLNNNRIPGAFKTGRRWNIPKDTSKPIDKRTSYSKEQMDKKVMVIAGINSEIGYELTKILLEKGYYVIGLYQKDSEINPELIRNDVKLIPVDYFTRNTLLDAVASIKGDVAGFVFMEIYFELEDSLDFDYDKFENSYKVNVFAANLLVRELVKKMNFESSIVIVNSIEAYRGSFGASAYASAQAAKVNLVQTFANVYTEMYGIRINSLVAGWIGGVMESDDSFNKAKSQIPMKRLGHPEEIADDIYLMLTRHKYMNGSSLVSDGGYLSFDEQSKTEDLDSGKFYRILDKFFTETKAGSEMWIISTMMDNEWNEDPAERKFIQSNFDAADRGVKMERIFLFSRKNISYYKTNKYIQRYLSSNKIVTKYVDLDELTEKKPELLKIINEGWIGIDDYALLVDLPSDGTSRGYVTMNKQEIKKAKNCFLELRKLAVPLKDVMK
ncbi:MAG: SDR family oxidoreductase [Bacilli bacterium]|nr:SDR family oxidoreductase [Bacilli bacterium]